jgi:hypothetical protein
MQFLWLLHFCLQLLRLLHDNLDLLHEFLLSDLDASVWRRRCRQLVRLRRNVWKHGSQHWHSDHNWERPGRSGSACGAIDLAGGHSGPHSGPADNCPIDSASDRPGGYARTDASDLSAGEWWRTAVADAQDQRYSGDERR